MPSPPLSRRRARNRSNSKGYGCHRCPGSQSPSPCTKKGAVNGGKYDRNSTTCSSTWEMLLILPEVVRPWRIENYTNLKLSSSEGVEGGYKILRRCTRLWRCALRKKWKIHPRNYFTNFVFLQADFCLTWIEMVKHWGHEKTMTHILRN